MSNKKLPRYRYPVIIQIAYDPLAQSAPLRFVLHGRVIDCSDISKIDEDDFRIIFGMALGLQQTMDTEYLRRHPEMMEGRADLEDSFEKWCKSNGLQSPNPTPEI